jgi:hypothetical protein
MCTATRPGDKKKIEMLVDEIAAFRKLGQPNRGVYASGPLAGQPLPPHPAAVRGPAGPAIGRESMMLLGLVEAIARDVAERNRGWPY